MLPWLVVAVLSGIAIGGRDGTVQLPCALLPNGQVSIVPGPACPLPPMARIVGTRVEGREGLALTTAIRRARARRAPLDVGWRDHGASAWARLPVLRRTPLEAWRAWFASLSATALLALVPLLWVRRSRSDAAVPFALFYTSVAAVALRTLTPLPGAGLDAAGLAAALLAGASLAHLGLVFPLTREWLTRSPGLVRVPYLAAGFAYPVALAALHGNSLVWSVGVRLWVIGFLTLWAVLVVAAGRAAREAGRQFAGVHARAFLWGTVWIVGLPLVLALSAGHLRLALALAVVVAPLPIGLAASRYPVHDLGFDVRRGLARVLLYSAAASLGAGGFVLTGPATLVEIGWVWLAAAGVAAAFDLLRRVSLRRLERGLVPEVERLHARAQAYAAEVATLMPEDEITARLQHAVCDGLRTRAVGYLPDDTGRVGPGREAAVGFAGLADDAARVLSGGSCVLLTAVPGAAREVGSLVAHGIALVASVSSGTQRAGILYAGPESRASAYNGIHASFVSTVVAHASVAIRNARIGESLLAAERRAAAGRAALAMAHDVGKELDWIRRLAARLPERAADRARWQRDVGTLRELADELSRTVRARVRNAGRSLASGQAVALSEAIGRVKRGVRHTGAAGLVCQVPEDAAGRLVPLDLAFVVGALVDNAVKATPTGAWVYLSAGVAGSGLRIAVRDHGPGPADTPHWLEAGWSGGGDGAGVGLSLASEMARGLGGELRFEAAAGGGTRAVVTLPCAA